MLVLSFKKGRKAITSNGIVIEVIEIKADSVRLGFHADPSIIIDRESVHKAKQGKVKVSA